MCRYLLIEPITSQFVLRYLTEIGPYAYYNEKNSVRVGIPYRTFHLIRETFSAFLAVVVLRNYKRFSIAILLVFKKRNTSPISEIYFLLHIRFLLEEIGR